MILLKNDPQQDRRESASGKRKRSAELILTPRQVSRIGSRPQSQQNLLKRCFLGKASPRQAIKMMCLECCGNDRLMAADCADRCCPLWAYQRGGRYSAEGPLLRKQRQAGK